MIENALRDIFLFRVLIESIKYFYQLVVPFCFAVIEQKWPKIVFMSEISFELQIIFKINIHILAQFLHVERAYELQVFLSDSEARKHVIWTPLAWISLASAVCCVFLRECCSLAHVRRQGLMVVTLSFSTFSRRVTYVQIHFSQKYRSLLSLCRPWKSNLRVHSQRKSRLRTVEICQILTGKLP